MRIRELIDDGNWADVEDGYIRASGEALSRPHAINWDHVLEAIKGMVNRNHYDKVDFNWALTQFYIEMKIDLRTPLTGKLDGANRVLSKEDFEHIVMRMRELIDDENWADIEDSYI